MDLQRQEDHYIFYLEMASWYRRGNGRQTLDGMTKYLILFFSLLLATYTRLDSLYIPLY